MKPANPAYGLAMCNLDVLIVEDNSAMRVLLRTLLNAFGVKSISQACDGSEALRMIPKGRYNLIISDWEMAPMKGGDFLKELRRIGNEPHCFTPVIVLTGYASRKLIQEAFDFGATHMLVKPVTAVGLLQRIEWVLEDNRPYDVTGAIYRQPIPMASAPATPAATGRHPREEEPLRESWTVD